MKALACCGGWCGFSSSEGSYGGREIAYSEVLPLGPTVHHCPGQASAWEAIQPCFLLLRSSLFGQCCRLLKAGKQVLWHGEIERIFLFDGKGGVKKIKSEQADSVGYLLSGTDCSMQIR